MRIFVTGGAGYVGSHCVRHLVSAGHAVTVYDSLIHGHRRAVDPKAEFIQGDLADAKTLDQAFVAGHYDALMHFAAFLNVGESVAQPLKYYRNNIANTITLLECMQRAGIQRMVFSSTCAIYGEPDDLPITEDLPKQPISPYGCSKLAIEWLLRDSAVAWGLGSASLRYFNAAGAAADGTIGEDHSPEIHLIPVVLQVAQGKRQNLKVFGTDFPTPDGTCVRDYVHVEDLADAHLRAVQSLKDGVAEGFNVGTGRGTSVLEIISAARTVTGHGIPVELTERRAGDPPALYASSDKLQNRFGWEPRYRDVEAIIETAWRWHKAHPDGFGPE